VQEQHGAQLQSLGNYRLLAALATGGMAKVYLALRAGPAGFNKLLVLKVLRDDSPAGAEESLRMFWDEARLSAQLVHPNIVHTFEVGEIDHEYFLAMEYLDGQTYRSVFRRALEHGGLPLPEQLRILSETARGLHYAHELCDYSGHPLGVVHRDVSPQNVFITYDGQVKLLDFGIAKTRDAEHATKIGVIKGKLDYMAPEQVRGDPLDARADVFALGAMLYEAISSTRFAGARGLSQVARLHARLAGSEVPLRTLVPHVPEALARIVDMALALDPARRFQDALTFAESIDAYVATLPGKPASAKSLGAFTSQLFEAERAAMHKLIEAQIHSVQRGTYLDGSGELPRLNPGDTRSTSGQFVGELDERSRSLHRPTSPLATGAAASLAPRPAKGRVTLVLGAALLAGVGLGFWQSTSTTEPANGDAKAAATGNAPAPAEDSLTLAAPPPTSVQAGAPPPQAEAAPARVIIELRVTPPGASVHIDGKPVASPFAGEFDKSSTPHRVEVTAAGYEPFARTLPFDQARSMEIALTPLAETSARRSRRAERSEAERGGVYQPPANEASSVGAQRGEPPAPAPGTELAPRRRIRTGVIDLVDPYASPP
jgi:serine/threonine protein kinase